MYILFYEINFIHVLLNSETNQFIDLTSLLVFLFKYVDFSVYFWSAKINLTLNQFVLLTLYFNTCLT